MDITSRKMWYLKNLFHCKENGWILITHEYMRNHFEELQDSITDRFVEQFEMRRFALEEVQDVEQYFIPDELFEELERKEGSRTELLFKLSECSNPQLSKCLQTIFSQIRKRHPDEMIDGIFHCLEGFESLREVATMYDCPLINYSFSAFRKVHGYCQTLYSANLRDHFWDGRECRARFQNFLREDSTSLPIFSNEEIITMIGKEHTLPFIKLINSQPKYEIGVCCECYSLLPQVFKRWRYTDDDIFYECKKLFGSEKLKVRSHASHLNDIQVDRNEVHNDPVSFILSCKRLTAVQSQILLKVLLWKRAAILKNDSLAFSYLCKEDFISEGIADINALNYYIFGFLIPSDLMFSDEYWKWRLTSPSEVEIYWAHLNFLCQALDIDKEKLLSLRGKERFRYLLQARNCDKQLIENLLSGNVVENINWDVASSKFEVITAVCSKPYWRIDTENPDGSLTSRLSVEVKDALAVKFYPLDDVAGFSRICSVKINGQEYNMDKAWKEYKYMPKSNGFYIIDVEKKLKNLHVEVTWNYKKVNEFLNSQVV